VRAGAAPNRARDRAARQDRRPEGLSHGERPEDPDPEDPGLPAGVDPGRHARPAGDGAAGRPDQAVVAKRARGVLIDISALELVDSFIGRMLNNIAAMSKVLDAVTVVVGMRH